MSKKMLYRDKSLEASCALLIFSFLCQAVNFDIFYSVKLYMISVPLLTFLYLKRSIGSFLAYEVFWLAFITYFIATSLWSDYLFLGFKMSIGLMVIFALYLMTRNFLSGVSKEVFFRAVLISGLTFNIMSLALYLIGLYFVGGDFSSVGLEKSWGVVLDRGVPRLVGLVEDPNFFVAFNIFFFFISLLFIRSKGFCLLFLLSLLSIMLTFSRGGAVALIAGIFLVFVLSPLKSKFVYLLFFLFLSIVVFLYVTSDDLVMSFVESRASSAMEGSGRFEMWQNGYDLFLEAPVFGHGVFSSRSLNIEYFNDSHYFHNSYLEIMIEGGLVGLLLFVSFNLIAPASLIFRSGSKRLSIKRLSNFSIALLSSHASLLVLFFSLSAYANEIFIILFSFYYYILRSRGDVIYYEGDAERM